MYDKYIREGCMLGATEERLNVGNSLGYPPKAAGSIPALSAMTSEDVLK